MDERAAPPALVLDRDMVEGSPPATAWALRLGILLALLPRRETSRLSLSMRMGVIAALLGGAIVPAHATDYYWDINGATAGSGGTTPSGTWSTTA